jgi:hypothetical protein
MNRIVVLGALLALLVPGGAEASDDQAENHLVDAADAYRAEDWDASLAAIQKARAEVVSPALRAQIERQAGLVMIAVDRPEEALAAFRLALSFDPKLELSAKRVGLGVNALFECARRLPASHPRVVKLEAGAQRGWVCPGDEVASSAAARSGAAPAGAVEARTEPPASATPGRTGGDLVAPAPQPTGGGLGAIGITGLSLLVAGAAGGGGVFAWQTAAASASADEAADLRKELDGKDRVDERRALLNELNAVTQREADQRGRAQTAALVGGGVAGVGLVLLLIDLFSDDGTAAPTAWRVGVGPTAASVTLTF